MGIAKSKIYFQKTTEILKGRGVHDYGILRAWGGNAFWNFRSQGGVKTWKPSVVGYGYFLELPNVYFYRILNNENFKMEVEQMNFVMHLIITVQIYY